jgi:hypothetical protein
VRQDVLQLDVARHLWGDSRPGATSVNDPEQVFKLALSATQTDILELEGEVIPKKINYRILEDSYSVVLSPLALVNNFNVPLRSLKINLPDQIRSNCLTISQYTTVDNEAAIVIDTITETNVLITAIVKLSDFIAASQPTISSDNYREWCNISQPYGFDIRKPHILYAYRHDCLVILLKDGGIIALQRHSNFETEPVIFNDNSYLESLGQLWKPWSKKPHFNDKELSEKTAIEVIHFQDYLLTVTINRHLRIWSMTSHSLVLEKNLAEFWQSNNDNRLFFDSTPTKLLDVFTADIFGTNISYLTVFLPFGNGTFKIFSLNAESFDIIDLGSKYTFDVCIPSSNSIWQVGDFQLTKLEDSLQLWVLWKSNTSSFIQNLEIDQDLNAQWYGVHDSTINLAKRYTESWSEYYIRKLFKSGLYSKQIIETALPIFEEHFLGKIESESFDDLSLCDRVIKSVSRGITMNPMYQLTLETQWGRFYSLCQEFKNQADEPLKLHVETNAENIIVVNREDFAFVRPISETELLDYNKHLKLDAIGHLSHIGEHLKFLRIITDFKESLSGDSLTVVQSEVLRIFSHPSQTTDVILSSIYDSNLKEHVNPVNLTKLVQELTQFENVFSLVQDILKLQVKPVESPSLTKSRFTSFGVEILSEVMRDIVQVQRDVLFCLLILLLVLEFDDKNVFNDVSKEIVKLLINFEIFQESFEVGINNQGSIEVDEPMNSGKNLVQLVLASKYPDNFPVSQFHIVSFITNQVLPFIATPEYLQWVTTLLISKDLSDVVYNRLLRFFDFTAVFNLLKAVVFFKTAQPVKASKYFANHADEISKHQLTPLEKTAFKPVQDFLVFFNPNSGKYYLNVAILFLNNLNFDQAHFFISLLAEKRSGTGFDKKYLEHESYTLFTIAIEKLDFVLANDALPHIKDPKLREEAMTKFLYAMCKHQQINKLNEFSSFKGDAQMDELILKRAQTNDVSKSLWFYQVLYSHRLACGNFRGAAEGLYEFIVRNKGSTEDAIRLVLAELYSVVLNLVVTLNEDDQWLIRHGEEEDVLSLCDLKEEKQSLLRGFSRDLRAKYDS